MTDADICANCGDEFANHNYVKDSIDKYACPQPKRESGYGYGYSNNPFLFWPDCESCTEEEIATWTRAKQEWRETGTISSRAWGIGSYSIEIETFFELQEHDEYDEDIHD